jgi:hypothetical protein
MHPQIKQEDEDFAYSNGNLPLSVAFKMHSSIPPRQSGKLHEKPIVNKCKREPIGGPNSGRARSIGVFKEKWKSPMQPFAHLPQKTKARGKIPLDIMELQMKWKFIVGYILPTMRKRNQIFLKVGAERRLREMLITKGIEGKIGKSYLYMFCGESICRKLPQSNMSCNINFY